MGTKQKMLKLRNHRRRFPILPLFLILLLFCSCAAGIKAHERIDPSEPFSDEINRFLEWDKKRNPPENATLFVGSSSIRLWNTSLAFPNLRSINRGFGGSQISDIIYYYEHIVNKYKPARIVFYAGDNDIAGGKSADRVFRDYVKFIRKVEQDLPETQVFFLSIKPSISRWHLWPEMSSANAKIKNLIATKPKLFYVDIASIMLNKRSEPDPALFTDDGLHLNDRGYQLWKKVLSPFIEQD